jgi:heme A synthase
VRAIHRLAVATAAATFLLLLIGGLVNPTGSSLACPDYPLCHGHAFPIMKGGVLFEHSHRLAALTVILLTCTLASLLWEKRMGRLGLAALATIYVQAALGGITVLLKLPHIVSIAHLGVSMIVFCWMIYLAVRTREGRSPAVLPSVARALVVIATAGVYVQIVLGAVVRHTGAWAACLTEIPFCGGGKLWPTDLPWYARLQMAHRIFGTVVALVVIAAAILVVRATKGWPRVLAILASVLVLVQILLGALAVTSFRGLPQVEAHLGTGAALLATMWLLTLSTRRAALTAPAAIPDGEAAAA